MSHWDQDTQSEVEVLSGCFWMARREAVEKVGGLDERFFFYAEDIDWCKRFWDGGWKVVLVPAATATHFDGGSSMNAPLRYNVEMLRANLAYWRKHRGVSGKIICLALYIIHHALRLGLFGLKMLAMRNCGDDTNQKWRRSMVCLGWLLTGRDCAAQRYIPGFRLKGHWVSRTLRRCQLSGLGSLSPKEPRGAQDQKNCDPASQRRAVSNGLFLEPARATGRAKAASYLRCALLPFDST